MGKGCRNALIAMFMSILILPSVIWGALNVLDAAGVLSISDIDVDTGEKRDKAELDGIEEKSDTTEVLTEYYNDRLPFRSQIILLNRKINSRMERSYKAYVDNIYSGGRTVEDMVVQATVTAPLKDDDATKTEAVTQVQDSSDIKETEKSEAVTEEATDTEETEETEETATETESLEEQISEQESVPETTEEENVYEEVDINALPYFPMRIYNDQVIEGRDGWLFYGIKTNRDNYEGRAIPGQQQLEEYAKIMIATKSACDDTGKEFRVLICPDKETIYPEYYPTVEFASELRRPQVVYEYMRSATDVDYIYPLAELKSAKKICRLYYAYDSHWNGAGGYVGSKSLLESLGIQMKTLSECKPAEFVPVSGDLVLLGNLDIADYGNDVDYYIDSDPYHSIMTVSELAEDGKVEEYVSSADDHRKLVIIGDSYSEQMMKYLTDVFTKVVFVHKLSVDTEAAREAIKNADIIVIESVERNVMTVTETAGSVMRQLQAEE